MNIGTIVSLGLTGIFALFIIVGVIVGAIRGAKRSGVRLGTIVITLVISFFLTAVISGMLLKINISFLHINVNGVTVSSVKQFVELTLQNVLKGYDIDVTSLSNLAIALATMIVNTIVFPVLFLVLRYLLLPLHMLLCRLIFGKKVKVAKGEPKPKKYGAIGGVIGGFTGLLISSVVMSPVVGYMTTANLLEQATKNNQEKGIVSQKAGDMYDKVFNGYSKSPYYYISKYTGTQALANWMFDGVSVAKINGKTIKINKEIKTLAGAYKDLKDIIEGLGLGRDREAIQNVSQQQFTEYLRAVDRVLTLCYQSNLIITIGDAVVPVGVAFIEKTVESGVDEYTKELIHASARIAKEYSFESAKEVVNGTLSVMNKLNDREILLPLLQGKINSFDDLSGKLDKELARDVMTSLFSIRLISDVSVELTNAAINYLTKMAEVEYEKAQEVTAEQAKQALTDIVVSFADAITGVDAESWMYYKEADIEKIGMVLDTIKHSAVITPQTYTAIVDKIENKLKDVIDETEFSEQICNDLKQAIDRISDIDNWTGEFTKIHKVVTALNNAIADENKQIKDGIENYDFEYLGKALDELNTTYAFDTTQGGVSVQTLASHIIEWVKDDQLGETGADIAGTIALLESNTLGVTSWQTSLAKVKELVVELKNMTKYDDIVEEFKTGTLALKIGSALDKAKTSELFANNADRVFAKEILEKVKSSIVGDGTSATDKAISKAVEQMQDNIDNATTIRWANEFADLKDLFASDLDEMDIDNMQPLTQTIDAIIERNHVIITNSVINSMLKEVINGSQEIKDLKDKPEYEEAITHIITNIDSLSGAVYTSEVGYLKSLKDVLNDTSTDLAGFSHNVAEIEFDNAEQLEYFGGKFDAISPSVLVGGTGYDIVSYALDDYIDDKGVSYEYRSVLMSVRDNLDALQGGHTTNDTYYTDIFTAFGDVANISISPVDKDHIEDAATEVETMLEEKQLNILIRYNGAAEISKIAMNKVYTALEQKRAEAELIPDPTAKAQKLAQLDDAEHYIDLYKTYLDSISGNQPYNSDTYQSATVGSETIQINKPFTHVASMIV
ncbi:MAG: hypothetical protein J6X00_01995 [Clostridia bacterium]|nr:hypothetical protein [Clostridia bacterium]